MKLSKQKQIAHIKQNQGKFDVLHGYHRDVAEYFRDYHKQFKSEGNSIYLCLCNDMGIKPLKGTPE